jgi:hypothetical protein
MQVKRFTTIDGETLMNTPLEPIRFVVDGLLAPGLHLLAGAAKVGKSWLALWLCQQVANGNPVWEFDTQNVPFSISRWRTPLTVYISGYPT